MWTDLGLSIGFSKDQRSFWLDQGWKGYARLTGLKLFFDDLYVVRLTSACSTRNGEPVEGERLLPGELDFTEVAYD